MKVSGGISGAQVVRHYLYDSSPCRVARRRKCSRIISPPAGSKVDDPWSLRRQFLDALSLSRASFSQLFPSCDQTHAKADLVRDVILLISLPSLSPFHFSSSLRPFPCKVLHLSTKRNSDLFFLGKLSSPKPTQGWLSDFETSEVASTPVGYLVTMVPGVVLLVSFLGALIIRTRKRNKRMALITRRTQNTSYLILLTEPNCHLQAVPIIPFAMDLPPCHQHVTQSDVSHDLNNNHLIACLLRTIS